MNTLKKLLDPGQPWLLLAVLCALFALGGCAAAPAGSTPAADAPLTAHDARAAQAIALQKIGESATDGETKRLAIFAVMALGQQGGHADAPAPVVIQNRSIGDAVLGLADRIFSGAERLAVPYLAYRGQVRSAQTTEAVAAINRDVALNQSNNFLALGAAGIGGTQAVGVAGVNALANVASRPAPPTTNVSGNTGPVLIGGGNLNSGSLNPVNPAPVICFGGTATAAGTCSRGP